MEIDSMHSEIETEKKYTPVYNIHAWLINVRRA
jgi:hypothetical protein